MNNSVKAVVPVIIGLGLWAIPAPTGLDHNAWTYFALFATVVAALVLEPIPEPIPPTLAVPAGVTLATIFRLVPITPGQAPTTADAIKWCLSGFSDGTVDWWLFGLIFGAIYLGVFLLVGLPWNLARG
jgi:L-tartrate/succinate antiporter